jgi:hypothetical protein
VRDDDGLGGAEGRLREALAKDSALAAVEGFVTSVVRVEGAF